jgi:hypothetical protein
MPPLPLLTKPAKLFALISLATLTGCATMTTSAAPTSDRVACQSFHPWYWSKNDTDKTIAQAKEHNAAWKAICGQKAKPKPQAWALSSRWLAALK